MAEKVGALAYDLVMNTVRFERGAEKTRSSLRTLNQNFKKAAKPVDEYHQRMRDLELALKNEHISPEQFKTFQEQELKALEKAGFYFDENNKAQKTEIKLLEEKHQLLKENNDRKRLENKIKQEEAFSQKSEFTKRRFRSEKEHNEVMRRLFERRKFNAKSHEVLMLNIRERMRLNMAAMRGATSGRAAAIAGNFAGFLGASGQQIGGVRAAMQFGIGRALPLLGGAAMGLGGIKAIKEADELKRSMIDLQVLMGGSAESAEKLVDGFQKLARKTPLATKQLTEGARQLMAFGRSSSKVTKDLEVIGTIAGGDPERFRLLIKAFGDVTAAGKLQGQELRQMTNQGFNPLRAMVEMTGKSYADLRKEMEAGQISAQMVSQAMSHQAEQYAGRLEASMDTVSGQFSRLKGLFSELFSTIGEKSFLRAGAVKVIEKLGDAMEGTMNLGNRLKEDLEFAGKNAAFVVEGLRKIFAGESERSPLEGFMKNYNELLKTHPDVLKAQEKAYGDSVRAYQRQVRGEQESFEAMIEQQSAIMALISEEHKKRLEHKNKILGLTKEEVELRKMQQELGQAEFKGMTQRADRIRATIALQKELMLEQKKLSDAKKVLELEKEYINEAYDLEEKRIADVFAKKTKAIDKELSQQQALANATKTAGGAAEDLTVGGADYRFVQERQQTTEALRIQKRAIVKAEQQRNALIELAEEERRANEEWRKRHPANVFEVN